jgi:hypothetical protein
MAFGCKAVDLDLMAFDWKLEDHGFDVHVRFGSVCGYIERTSKRWRDVPVRVGSFGGYIESELTDIPVKWKNVY